MSNLTSKSDVGKPYPQIIRELGDLPPGALITRRGLADMFGRHESYVDRAINEGELPPTANIGGTHLWTAAAILRHIEKRLAKAAEDFERDARKLEQLEQLKA